MSTYVLAIYELDRHYGGPEEGGWWFDSGELQRTLRVFGSERKAYAAARRCNDWLYLLQKGHRKLSSVLYSGGRLSAAVYPDRAPAHYPEERPRYE